MDRVPLLARRWLLPPVFDDDRQSHQARILWVVLLLTVLVSPLHFVSAYLDPSHASRFLSVGVFILSLGGVLFWLTRAGRTGLASWLCISLSWALATWAIVTSGGVLAVASLSYLVFIVLAGQLFGVRGGLVMFGLNVVTAVLIEIAEATGHLPPSYPKTRSVTLVQTIYHMATIVALQAVSAKSVSDALAKAHREIDERRAAEDSLRASEGRLRAITSTIPGVVYLFRVSPDGQMAATYVSEQSEAILGFASDIERPFDRFAELVVPECRETFMSSIVKAVSARLEWKYEGRLRKPSGEIIWFNGQSSAVWMEGEDVVYSGVIVDVSQQRRAEEERARLAAILECTNDLVGTATPDGCMSYLNAAGRWMLGLDESVDIASCPVARYHPEWAFKVVSTEGIPQALAKGVWQGETAILGPGGREIPVSQTIMAHRSPAGDLQYMSTIMRDVSERRRAEEALARANTLMEAVIKQAPFAVHVLEGSLNNIRVVIENAESERIMGERVEGRAGIDAGSSGGLDVRFFGLDGEREIPLARTPGPRALLGETIVNEEFLFRYPDGRTLVVEASASPIRDREAQILAAVVTFHDITERKRAEHELRKLAAVVQRSKELVNLAEPDGRMAFLNEAGGQMLGIPPEHAGDHGVFEVISEEYHAVVRNEVLPALMRGETWEGELQYRNLQSGHLTDVYAMGFTITDPATGRLSYLVNISHDIGARKKAERELRFANAILRTQQETSPDGILVVDDKNHIVSHNQRFADMWGIPAELLEAGIDEPVLQLVASKVVDPEAFVSKVRDIYERRGECFQDEVMLVSESTFERHSAPMLDREGKYYGRVWYFRDITDRKRAERELLAAQQRLGDIIDFLPDATLVIDRDKRVIAWNRGSGAVDRREQGRGSRSDDLFVEFLRRPSVHPDRHRPGPERRDQEAIPHARAERQHGVRGILRSQGLGRQGCVLLGNGEQTVRRGRQRGRGR